MKEIEERKKRLKEAVEALRSKEEELSNLQAKRREVSNLSARSDTDINAAKAHRKEVMASFVTGKISQADLDRATRAMVEVEQEAKLSVEISEAIDLAFKKTEAEIQKLKIAIDTAKRSLWECLYDNIKKEAQAAVGNLALLAIAAKSRCGGWTYQETLLDLFGGGTGPIPSAPSFVVIDEATARLAKEYEIEV